MISVREVEEARILSSKNLRALGLDWFKDNDSGMCYRIEQQGETLIVKESRRSKAYKITPKKKRITIKCIDCGDPREIATQDKFQVKRCIDCQTTYRREKRKEYMRKKRGGTK